MSSQANQRIEALDGLRSIAIILVVLYHAAQILPQAHAESSGFSLLNVLHNGWAGVDLFFVLSGFLITSQLLVTSTQASSIKLYLCKRFIRIAPAYYIAVLATLFYRHIRSDFSLEGIYNTFTMWWTPVLSHFTFSNDYIGRTPSIDGVFWSIPIEMKFYLCAPAIVYLLLKIKKNSTRIIALGSIYLSYVLIRAFYIGTVYGYHPIEQSVYFSDIMSYFHFSLDGLILGMICGLIYASFDPQKHSNATLSMALLCVAALIISVLFLQKPHLSSAYVNYENAVFTKVLLSIGWALLMMSVLMRKSIASFFIHSAYGFIARISYSMYLTHLFALNFHNILTQKINDSLHAPTLSWCLSLPFYLMLCVCLAYLLYTYVEKPAMDRFKHSSFYRKLSQ